VPGDLIDNEQWDELAKLVREVAGIIE
ncbi:keto-hydroxyglutarate-aldolase/keto-deoxy-phosphogluconate aldolase, partial [Vibrio sp. 2132-1]|nr:keto-hydroxyglutarate-aldolase/keto-deoxy-phosphogluconate aldolase [Vibrio sp. 2132-1]